MSIPLYSYEVALLDFISEKRALRLENAGIANLRCLPNGRISKGGHHPCVRAKSTAVTNVES